ncbi:MAG: glycosyltransferase family 4 protein [Deltaproteobacteria bacterium]|nr:glycosyltransferase family 4 protein [Deltaproteobacteria bacterium]
MLSNSIEIEASAQRDAVASAPAAGHGGVLLVGNLPDGPLVGGVEVGVEMILRSDLVARHGIRLFNTARRHDPNRPLRQRLAYQARRFIELAAEITRNRPRLVHVKATVGINFWQGAGYCAIARALGRRVLLQLHGGDLDSWYWQHGPWGRSAIRRALRLPSEILVLSQYWRDFIAGLQPGHPIRILPNGVRLEDAQPRTWNGSTHLRVVTLGALGERKGHFDILAAAVRLRQQAIRFVFAGAGEFGGEEAALRARARDLGVEHLVEFTGAVTGPEKWQLLAQSDVFLLPSRGENMPNAVLEAMAAGLPVVCTPVGALRDMMTEGAMFVPVGNPAAIARALLDLQQSPQLRVHMGRANRATAESRFAFTAVAAELGAIYAES